MTQTLSVFGGHTVPHSIVKSKQAGRTVTDYLGRLLEREGLQMSESGISAWVQIVRDIKEKTCFVAPEQTSLFIDDQQGGIGKKTRYSLPD